MDDQAAWVEDKYDEIPENYRIAIAFTERERTLIGIVVFNVLNIPSS